MIRPDGSSVVVGSPTGHMIEQIAVAPDGQVWFSEDASSELHVYDPAASTYSTVSLGAIASGGFWNGMDVGVSTSGEIWAATDKGVAKIAPDGTLLTVTPYAPRTLPVTPSTASAHSGRPSTALASAGSETSRDRAASGGALGRARGALH
jgi:streptogramin lyase